MKFINKIPVFDWFYEQGDVYITLLISGSDQIEIPSSIHEKKMETFVVGNSSTPNLTYDKKGINAPMKFGNNYFNCFFPWECISVMSGPNAVIELTTEEKSKTGQSHLKPGKKKFPLNKKKKPSRDRSHLKVVK